MGGLHITAITCHFSNYSSLSFLKGDQFLWSSCCLAPPLPFDHRSNTRLVLGLLPPSSVTSTPRSQQLTCQCVPRFLLFCSHITDCHHQECLWLTAHCDTLILQPPRVIHSWPLIHPLHAFPHPSEISSAPELHTCPHPPECPSHFPPCAS